MTSTMKPLGAFGGRASLSASRRERLEADMTADLGAVQSEPPRD
ncbi:hypothetical protein [Gluconobacter cerinus]|nr:hypothetical protein [Gluconobacter cerinus]